MKLTHLLKPTGIKTIKQMVDKTGLSRYTCHMLWHGNANCGRIAGQAISRATGLPLELIFEACNDKRRNRLRR